MLCLESTCFALEWKDSAELEAMFADAGIRGTFVLYDSKEDVLIGNNKPRAYRRFIPASTFKIPNTLIGLTVGAVKDVDEVLPYGGGPQFLKQWEQDMSLRDAIVISNVPIYRELARRIGLERMRSNVAQIDYGNNEIGDVVDLFWLKGPLEISPVEQTLFLNGLARGQLPFPGEAQEAVREITLIEEGDGWELHAKTGRAAMDPDIGWWVGWIAKGNDVYAFALNIEIQNPDEVDKRIPLGRMALKRLGILPDPK